MTLHIYNLGDEITSDSLEAVFATHGTVHSFSIIKNQVNGLPEHHAFIEMPDEVQAQLAIEKIDGFILNGRAIKVLKASNK